MRDSLIVVGGGAAGMTAALLAAREGLSVTVLEQMEQPGKKLAITGKGRCNLTNACARETFFSNLPHNPRFLYSAFASFDTTDTMQLFESLGVPLKVERGDRVFPVSDSAKQVVGALQDALTKSGVRLKTGVRVKRLWLEDGAVQGVECADGTRLAARSVLIATGGCSYPMTGSDGSGYQLAKQAGHTLIAPTPALVPLISSSTECREMMGLSLKNVALTLQEMGKKKAAFSQQGEMLFTHFGISGPLTLSASSYLKPNVAYRLWIDWKPALTADQLDARILRELEAAPKKEVAAVLRTLLPASAVSVFAKRCSFEQGLLAAGWTREHRATLVQLLKHFDLPYHGLRPVKEAIITRGGVSVKEVDPGTMASKCCKNLYFAGEILDVDGLTGGFNLQIAFSTAHAAACGIVNHLHEIN